MNVAIVKYNAGNIYSVVNALRRLGVEPLLTDDPEQLMKAERVLFPGQGEASNCMRYLKEHQLDTVIKDLRQPVLGICIGQQLLCRHSEEGDTDCIGVFDVDVKRFQPQNHQDKVPCMGWNTLNFKGNEGAWERGSEGTGERGNEGTGERGNEGTGVRKSDLFAGLGNNPYVYFVHSYYVPICEWTVAETQYILPYSAALQKDNFQTCQFHPEKSGKVGEKILEQFLRQQTK